MNPVSKLILATACTLLLGVQAHAEDTIVGDPSKGTPITTVQDGKNKVLITTSGISVTAQDSKDNDSDKDVFSKEGDKKVIKIRHEKTFLKEVEDIVVPIAFFLFLLAAILGRRYFASRDEQRRLDVLRAMVEKGQPVPETIVSQILSPRPTPEADGTRQSYKRTRNAVGFTLAGVLLIGHALITHEWYNSGELIPGLIFICLGLGGLSALYLNKREEKIPN